MCLKRELCVRIENRDYGWSLRTYVVFEREAREIQSYQFSYSNHINSLTQITSVLSLKSHQFSYSNHISSLTQITKRISLESLAHIIRIDTNARTHRYVQRQSMRNRHCVTYAIDMKCSHLHRRIETDLCRCVVVRILHNDVLFIPPQRKRSTSQEASCWTI